MLGAADGEGLACEAVDFALQFGDARGEGGRQSGELFAVHQNAAPFHGGDHRDEGAINALVDAGCALCGEARGE